MTSESTTPETPRPSRRRFGAGALVAVGIASAAIAGGGALLLARRPPAQSAPAAQGEVAKEMYQCPMHPTVVQDHPGDCPICGMKLVKMEPAGGRDHRLLYYRSPMDPKQTSPTPRKDEMGMDYLPVYSDDVAGGAAPVAGLATVNIDPMRQQLIGLETAAVSRGQVGGAWRTVGRVAMDETRVRHINVKIPAYVERIHVDFVGKPVRRGEPLFSIYSPELLSAQEEYLLAVKTRSSLSGAGGHSADGDDLVSSARRKLQLWDVPEPEIARLEKTGQPTKTLTIFSPIAGVVTKKDVVEGMKLDAGAMPYEIVDLSQVWVLADVYENELRHVKVGMPATLTLNAYPNRAFQGRVQFIDPLLDPKTRTVKVRLAFPNPTGELKPEMFGEVVLQGATRQGLRIPADAVIDSGTNHVVFVAAGEGKFQPRQVELGDSDGQSVEVISGVSEGERVVTRANFLVDSESRLRASLAEMASKQGAAPAAAAPASTGPASPSPTPAAPAAPPKEPGAGAHAGHGGRKP